MIKMLMAMIVFTSSICLGFATQSENLIPEKQNAIIEQGDTSESEPISVPPILEKCKKKKK